MEAFTFIMTVDQKLGVKGYELGGRGVEQAKQQAASIFVPSIAVPFTAVQVVLNLSDPPTFSPSLFLSLWSPSRQ